jgi:predicted deacylase
MHSGYVSPVINEKSMHNIKSNHGGILYLKKQANEEVKAGDLLAEILDPYDGSLLSEIVAPVSGVIFFALQSPLVSQNTLIYKMVKYT